MSLEKLLERLERQNWRFKRGIVLAVVLAASALLAGAARRIPSDIASHRFTLADPKEKTAIACLLVMKNGHPAMFFRDSARKFRSVLAIHSSGGVSIDFRETGTGRAASQ